jgi:bacillithiol system protein YtxJ
MQALRSTLDFDELCRAPKAVVLLKHSTRCPVSAVAFQEIAELCERQPALDVYIVDVNAQREVSNYIAERLAVEHDSPQVILLVRGTSVWHAEHFEIVAAEIAGQLGVRCA